MNVSLETADENSGFQQKNLENPVLPDMQKNLFEYRVRCSTSPMAGEQIIKALSNATCPGRPVVFTAEQIVQIIAMACEVKDDSDEATGHHTWENIVRESVNRGIVKKISVSSVGRFLSEAHIKPRRSRYQLKASPENPELFEQDIKKICGLYHQASEQFKEGVYLVSTDEKTGIQALERRCPAHPAIPDKRYVATKCGIEKDLGIKGKSGISESMATRNFFYLTLNTASVSSTLQNIPHG